MPENAQRKMASYAARSADSCGRVHAEPPDPIRDAFGLDRHRVLSCAAFRRLEYKTQVFVTFEDDHFRTRLTHTLEVAEIARRLAIALDVNPTLAEVISLTHDLGHPPFGHAGEMALRDLMQLHGGFEHNRQSLRIVDYLEHPYPAFRGLNLSFEVREGIAKHETRYDSPNASENAYPPATEFFASGQWPTVEGQIACLADELAYDGHDLEDAIGAALIDEADLHAVTLWQMAAEPVRAAHPDLPLPAIRRPILDALLNTLLADVIAESRRRIAAARPQTPDAVRKATDPLVAFSDAMSSMARELGSFLLERVYRHARLVRMDTKARRFIERLFAAYAADPRMLPERFFRRIDEQGVHRVVCDYVAGMTDRFCQDDYKRLFEPFERV
ncbi:MAG: deoxyguanosinetriphosphate triphosphohydrolase [Phycisphaerae bacterium]|nr:deoxyguanosinetriphosphate triphosphohydrolase [Phycisphaerae bacterium]